MNLYKGYTKNSGKRPVDKLNGVTEFRTLEEVKHFDSYGAVLADDAILIDIDDPAQSEILMCIVEDLQLNCQVTKTTRGRHFTFRNSGVTVGGTEKKLACGLTADIKVGGKNTVECLKIDGNERFVEWEFVDDDTTSLPKWLHPVNSKVDFFNMEEGEGRDSSLYGYILTLTNAGFSMEETRECIKVINKWILKDSLSDDDIERITRDDAFPEETFFKGKAFLHNNFGLFLKNNDNIVRINGQLHIFKDGCYIPGVREIESKMVKYIPNLKAAQRIEVLKYLEIICPSNTTVADANYIAFNNGIYDVANDELKDFSPGVVITNKIPWDYNPDAYSEIADKTLNKLACNDKQIRALLEECIGACFFRSNTLAGGKAFILTGDKSNGKSTFLDMVKNVLGERNVSALDLGELDERFSTATMSGMLANIGDDISDEFLQGKILAIFKKIVTGNEIKAEFKGMDAFFFTPYLKLLFSANDIPRMKDKSGAVQRRLVIVPFNAKFSKTDPDYDPYITWKLRDKEVMEYIIQLGISGLKRVMENNSFTESVKVQKELEDFELQNNPILLFLQEKELWEIINQPTKDIHKAYKMFCVENGFAEMTLSTFSKELSRRCGLVVKRQRINGSLVSIYVKEGQ